MKECLFDTDILSFYLKGVETVKKNVEEYLFATNSEELTFSEITYYEIKAGLEYKQAKKQLRVFEDFASKCKILTLTKSSLNISASRYGQLRRKGILIGTPDLLIAGIAIDYNLVLVTNNTKHYKHIDGIQLTNWSE